MGTHRSAPPPAHPKPISPPEPAPVSRVPHDIKGPAFSPKVTPCCNLSGELFPSLTLRPFLLSAPASETSLAPCRCREISPLRITPLGGKGLNQAHHPKHRYGERAGWRSRGRLGYLCRITASRFLPRCLLRTRVWPCSQKLCRKVHGLTPTDPSLGESGPCHRLES